jgi:pseudouridine synthase
MRINQYLAFCLGISRRQGDQMITENKVRLNGKKAELHNRVEEKDIVETQVGQNWARVKPKNLLTRENGKVVKIGQKVVVLMYKPIFCLTTREEKQDFNLKSPKTEYQSGFKSYTNQKSKTETKKGPRKIIYDFLPPEFRVLKPAGRLDYMSEGLLVLTNDGDLIQKLTSAKSQTEKVYLVGLKQTFTKEQLDLMEGKSKGLVVDNYTLNPMKVKPLFSVIEPVNSENFLADNDQTIAKTETNKLQSKPNFKQKNQPLPIPNISLNFQKLGFLKLEPSLYWYQFTLNEGRNRQIRKVCESFGLQVKRLIRIQQGEFVLTSEIKTKGFKII